MSLSSHQTLDGDTTHFKCYRSVRAGQSVVYVEINEGYDSPGWACGKSRRSTQLRMSRELLLELAKDFTQLAKSAEPDQDEFNRTIRAAWAEELAKVK